MRLKTFTAPSMAKAMAEIRASLGDDAIIVATRDGPGGTVQVTAAIEDEFLDDLAPSPILPAPPAAARIRVDPVDAVYRVLRDHGVPATVAEPLLEQASLVATGDPATTLAAALSRTFDFTPVGDAPPRGRPLLLVGPPGGGKTQTVAKLAATAVLQGLRVALVSTDTERTGGTGQLAAFAGALRLDVVGAAEPAALTNAVRRAGADAVIIDSAGRNHLDPVEMKRLRRLVEAADAEPLLVLPAGLDAYEAADIGQAFAAIGASRMVATRLDVARRFGGCLAAAHGANLAFAAFSTTPRIKNGLLAADPTGLAGLLLPPAAMTAPCQHTGSHR